ncbi:hypothetical protein [Burkholderia ubonensis]|uniref:hypothetical protein n=1 Tax=Burkholderia ubonensis TaxID=101571 RepID=UPI0009B47FF8|nr:hypothetical protein [Burkholderia ubonensis]
MNVFATLLRGNPTAFEAALCKRNGAGGLEATLQKLKVAEAAAMEYVKLNSVPSERASMQCYIEAILCAREELERFSLTLKPLLA